MKNLKNKPVIVEIDGETKEYSSLKAFSIDYDINYQTTLNWINKKTKPSININIYYK